jgi:hypothetical protein
LGVVLHYVARDRAIAAGRKINSRSKQFGNIATATMPRCSIKKIGPAKSPGRPDVAKEIPPQSLSSGMVL